MKKIRNLIHNIARSFRFSMRYAPILTVSLTVATIVTGLLPLYQAKVMGNIVNGVVDTVASNQGSRAIVMLVVLYSAVWAVTGIIRSVRFYFDRRWSITFEQGLEMEVMKKRSEIDLGHYESPHFQNLLTQAFNRGIWPIYNLVDVLMRNLSSVAVIIVSSLVTTAISPVIYLIILVTSIPSFVVNLKYGHNLWSIWGENSPRRRKYEHIYGHLRTRTGVVQTKIFQAGNKLLSMAQEFLTSFNKEQLGLDKKKTLLSVGADILAAGGYALSFWLIVREVLAGRQDVGSMVFLISIIGQLVGSINSFLSDIAIQFERNHFVNDIFKFFDTKPYITRAEHPVKLGLTSAPRIEFRNVSFKYADRPDWILRNINMIIEPGEKIALVGENGVGKSTLVKLLSRVYDPTEGTIYINNIPLTEIDIDEWGSYIAVLLQDYMTYDFTVSDAIGMGRASELVTDKERAIKAAQFSGADEFIKGYEKAYDQQLGKEFEGGIEPSKGQQQKIALARTIYRNAFVMVLDEPTAAIDALSEMRIFERMEEASSANSLIVITHRFNTTQSFDRIIVLEKGTIIEVGTHKELLAKKGLYKKMFDGQANAFKEEGK